MSQQFVFSQLQEQAIALRRAGKSRRQIKEILGVGNSTLDKALRGVPPQPWTHRPNAKDDLHAKARDLRARGYVYNEIAAELGVSKSSVSLWVRDMPRPGRLGSEEWSKCKAAGTVAYWQAEGLRREARRQAIRDLAVAEIGALSDREVLIGGAIAYWCEGEKNKPHRRSDRVSFVNSDPGLIIFFLTFLAVAGILPERLPCTNPRERRRCGSPAILARNHPDTRRTVSAANVEAAQSEDRPDEYGAGLPWLPGDYRSP